jgi:hypothetical protein
MPGQNISLRRFGFASSPGAAHLYRLPVIRAPLHSSRSAAKYQPQRRVPQVPLLHLGFLT